ncbi:MAG TPA: dihydropteroate synthase [Candidatus Caldiarchaeum subterraneum]|uniref:Dihydropteroate synthase n=1 Tax=Caldiarchaeum subterraneum TaxID=311458 RepID=A0A832ZW12_CALS0|nr:dihydropteroate synthase [Candidatus Caldarchaeum subterraneum]
MEPYAELGGIKIGKNHPTRIMGVINVSPESFFKHSVRQSEREVLDAVEHMIENGADILDIGGRSTAPYHTSTITVEEEIKRTKHIVELLTETFTIPVSIDTTRAEVAEYAAKAGATIVNDVYGFEDERIVEVVREYSMSAVVGVSPSKVETVKATVEETVEALKSSLAKAVEKGVEIKKLAVDPCIGFYGERGEYREEDVKRFLTELEQAETTPTVPWYVRDFLLLASIDKVQKALGRPAVVGVSRKSFLRLPTSRRKPEERLYASLAAEVYAVLKGAAVIRTHNVRETRDVAKVIEWIKLTEEKLAER